MDVFAEGPWVVDDSAKASAVGLGAVDAAADEGVPVYSIFSQQPATLASNADKPTRIPILTYARANRILLLYGPSTTRERQHQNHE